MYGNTRAIHRSKAWCRNRLASRRLMTPPVAFRASARRAGRPPSAQVHQPPLDIKQHPRTVREHLGRPEQQGPSPRLRLGTVGSPCHDAEAALSSCGLLVRFRLLSIHLAVTLLPSATSGVASHGLDFHLLTNQRHSQTIPDNRAQSGIEPGTAAMVAAWGPGRSMCAVLHVRGAVGKL